MHDRTTSGQGTRRVLLVVASLLIGSCVWFFLLDSEQIDAQEARGIAELTGPSLAAKVGDLGITQREIHDAIADELAAAEKRLLATALERRIRDLLLDQEAATHGVDRDTLIAREVDARLDSVSDAEVAEVLDRKGLPKTTDNVDAIRRELRLEAFVTELEQRADVARFTVGISQRRAAGPAERKTSAG